MASALTVEDGTGVIGANSYIELVDARDYFTARKLTIPNEDDQVEALLIQAVDYLESMPMTRFKGTWIYGPGYLQWPREGVWIENFQIPNDEIPQLLKDVQCQLAHELQTYNPLPTSDGRVIKRERVDVVETEYAVTAASGTPVPVLRKVEAMLAPLVLPIGYRLIRV